MIKQINSDDTWTRTNVIKSSQWRSELCELLI